MVKLYSSTLELLASIGKMCASYCKRSRLTAVLYYDFALAAYLSYTDGATKIPEVIYPCHYIGLKILSKTITSLILKIFHHHYGMLCICMKEYPVYCR